MGRTLKVRVYLLRLGGRAHDVVVLWDDEAAKRLGESIAHLRRERGLSQAELSRRAGLGVNHVQLIEAARASWRSGEGHPSNPKLSTLARLATSLDVTLAELFRSSDL